MNTMPSMATKRVSVHGLWSSRLAFILAVSGSAVGLGNIWKFPYITGKNGGGAFVLVYLVCVLAIGLPIMMSEVLIGRRGRRNPITTMRLVGQEEASQGWWQIVGIAGVGAGIVILSFYSVIAGWALAYVFQSLSGAYIGGDPETVASVFGGLTGSWQQLTAWHTAFMLMTVFVVGRGVQRGLEQAVRVLMPALLALLVLLLLYVLFAPAMREAQAFQQGLGFLFRADFASLTPESVLVALGHAFFTLSIGMGAVMAYGAYLPEGTNIATTSLAVVAADTIIALLAGMVIFPIVFAYGLAPDEGPGLIFNTLPLAFGQMKAGIIVGTLFFLLLSFAAWTSAIGLIEPAVAWLVERFQLKRAQAAALIGLVVWLLGLATVLSFNVWSGIDVWKGTPFDNFDFVASNIMLPAGGLLISIFAGWIMCRNSTSEELEMGTGTLYQTWRFLARYVAPAGVLLIFYSTFFG